MLIFVFFSFIAKSHVKPAPNFGDMHNRLFKKTESIDEVRNRHETRAKLLLSGKKPTTAQSKPNKHCIFRTHF